MTSTPINILLQTLIAQAPEEAKGSVALQLQIGAQQYAGSVKTASDIAEDLFEMICVDPQQQRAVSVYFVADSVTAVFVPKENKSTGVEVRRNGLIIPGAH